jgi:membrane-associated phospholipid phosphatase
VLKIAFGRPNPTAFYEAPLAGAFHPFRGEEFSSFPSGHMMLAGAFLGVFFRLCPGLRSAALLLLSFGGALLVLGDWHFVSDVIAGTFLGFSAGLMGGELWNQHNEAA